MKKGLSSDLIDKGIWHIHTDYTDGKNTVDDYARTASKLKIPLLCFTEHVRTELNYDFSEYLRDINSAKKQYPHIIFIAGVEVRGLPSGSLDISPDVLHKAEYVVASIHSFPKIKELYLDTLGKMFLNPYMDTWGHPFRFAVENNLKIEKIEALRIYQKAAMNKIMIEPPRMWAKIIGYYDLKKIDTDDIHMVEEMELYYERKKELYK